MKCPICGNLLPDDSEFCMYCGSNIEINKESKEKTTVDESFKSKKTSPAHIFFIMVFIISLGLNIFLYINRTNSITQLHNTNSNLEAENNALSKSNKDLISENEQLRKSNSELGDTIELKQKSMAKYKDALDDALDVLIDNVVFVGTGNLYHLWNCEDMNWKSFFAFNPEYAIGQGYNPCPKCIQNRPKNRFENADNWLEDYTIKEEIKNKYKNDYGISTSFEVSRG